MILRIPKQVGSGQGPAGSLLEVYRKPTAHRVLLGGLLYGLGFNLVLRPAPWGVLAPACALTGLFLFFRGLDWFAVAAEGLILWRHNVRRMAVLGAWAYGLAGAVGLFWMSCITVPAYIGVVAYLALYGAAFGAGAALIRRGAGAGAFPALAAALWAALEFLRAWAFTGFPWLLAGSVWAGLPAAMGLADLGGIFLVSFATVLVPALVAAEKPESPRRRAALAAAVALVALGYGLLTSAAMPWAPVADRAPPVRVAAVQPLVPFKVGPKADPEAMLREQQALSAPIAPGSIELLIWSETMVPGDLLEEAPVWLAPIARAKRCHFLAGGVIHEPGSGGQPAGRAFNSAALLAPDGKIAGRYDKRHLVPFGEYVPFGGRFPGAARIFQLIGTTFTPGDAHRPLPALDGLPLGVSICYEDAFPGLARRDAARGARLLVNLTNDSWFGRSSEARQHLALSAFRAVETRRPLVRATNTGITAMVDANGRITAPPEGALWQKGLARFDVPADEARRTLYVLAGDAFAWACVAAVAAALLAATLRQRRESPEPRP
jgi:apolipoprotein N-acyltransferase